MMELSGKTAIVCGASDGIGKATAIEMAAAGASVVLVARNLEKLSRVLGQLSTEAGQSHHVVVADFRDPEQLKLAIEKKLKETQAVDILVNNTGGPPGGKAIEAGLDEFQAAFDQHLKCNHLLVQAVIPQMRKQQSGRIINVISTSVKQPIDNLGVSNTIRGAVANWSKTLANELGADGITVNNVLPGATATGRLTEIVERSAVKTGVSTEAVVQRMQNAIPLGRFAEPREIAQAIVFLASSKASYITGVNLPVDGGRTQSL